MGPVVCQGGMENIFVKLRQGRQGFVCHLSAPVRACFALIRRVAFGGFTREIKPNNKSPGVTEAFMDRNDLLKSYDFYVSLPIGLGRLIAITLG
jgi:hypothetical protein